MSRLRKILLTTFLIITILILIATWYKLEFSMDLAEEYQLNSQDNMRSLVIATQGSDFKNSISTAIVDRYKQDSIFIKVMDISSLSEVQLQEPTAMLVIHTWENWKPPIEIKEFIERSSNHMEKIVVFTTSGEGSYKMENIDAITGESKMMNVDFYIKQIIEKLNPLLNNKNQ